MRAHLIAILAGTFLLTAGIAAIVFSLVFTEQVTSPVSFEVKQNIGFNLNPDGLHFGAGTPGATLQRDLIITANETYYYRITLSDNIADTVTPDRGYTGIIEAHTTEHIPFTATIHQGLPLGIYNGTVSVTLMRKLI